MCTMPQELTPWHKPLEVVSVCFSDTLKNLEKAMARINEVKMAELLWERIYENVSTGSEKSTCLNESVI